MGLTKEVFFFKYLVGETMLFSFKIAAHKVIDDSSNYINQNYPLLIWSGFEYLPLVIRRRLKGVINPPASV